MNLIFAKTNHVPLRRSCGFEKGGLEIRRLVWAKSVDQCGKSAAVLHAGNMTVAKKRREGLESWSDGVLE